MKTPEEWASEFSDKFGEAEVTYRFSTQDLEDFVKQIQRDGVKELIEYIRAMPFGHTRACSFDLSGHDPETDYCTCNLAGRREARRRLLKKYEQIDHSQSA